MYGNRSSIHTLLVAVVVLFVIGSIVGVGSVAAQSNTAPSSFSDTPAEDVTISVGESVTFSVGGSDQDGNLHGIEWYQNGNHLGNSYAIEGSSDTGQRTIPFDSPGTYRIEANLFDLETAYNNEPVEWTVTVVSENQPPEASPGGPYDEISVGPSERVTFEIDADDPDGNLDGVEWYIGDDFVEETSSIDSYSDVAEWEYRFDDTGIYEVDARVFDKERSYSSEVTWIIEIEANNNPPSISKVDPNDEVTVDSGERVEFVADVDDSDGNLDGVEWYVEGAFIDETTQIDGYSDTAEWEYTFDDPGTYLVEAESVDSNRTYSQPATWTVTVESKDEGPTIERETPIDQQVSLSEGATETFEVSASSDTSTLRSAEWEIDGKPIESTDLSGASSYASFDPTFEEVGTHTVAVKVVDAEGKTSKTIEWTAEVAVTDAEPMITKVTPSTGQSLSTGNGIDFSVEAQAANDELAEITYTVEETGVSETMSASGTVHSETWSHRFSSSGNYTISARAVDQMGRSSRTVSWDVSVNSRPSNDIAFENRGMYVWNSQGKISTSETYQNKLEYYIDEYDVNTIYLSWGNTAANPDETAALIESLHADGINVHAVVSDKRPSDAEKSAKEAIEYNANRPHKESFDGISFDVEATEIAPGEIESHYRNYNNMLTAVEQTQTAQLEEKLPISASFGVWALDNQRSAIQKHVYEHPSLDHVIVMAYRDESDEMKPLYEKISPESLPTTVAFETQEYTPTKITYYTKGPDKLKDNLRDFDENDLGKDNRGTIIHYAGSLQTWNAIEDVSAESDSRSNTVEIETDLLFMEVLETPREYQVCLKRDESSQSCLSSESVTVRGAMSTTVSLSVGRDRLDGDDVIVVLQDPVVPDRTDPYELDAWNLDVDSQEDETIDVEPRKEAPETEPQEDGTPKTEPPEEASTSDQLLSRVVELLFD